jgi:hypothetical protein
MLASLYNAGTRQVEIIQKDLDRMRSGDGGADVQGSLRFGIVIREAR